MSDLERLISQHFDNLDAQSPRGPLGTMRLVPLGTAYAVVWAAAQGAYTAGRVDGVSMAVGQKYLVVTEEQLKKLQGEAYGAWQLIPSSEQFVSCWRSCEVRGPRRVEA